MSCEAITLTFTEASPLGLKLINPTGTGSTIVSALVPGGQAERMSATLEIELAKFSGATVVSCDGQTLNIMALLKDRARPKRVRLALKPLALSEPRPSSSSVTTLSAQPYRGYAALVDASTLALSESLSTTIDQLNQTPLQSLLREDCVELRAYLDSRDVIPAFKLSLIKALTCYLTELPSRSPTMLTSKTTADARFSQLSTLIYALTSSELERQHPALLLSECDSVLRDIEREERSKSWLTRAYSPSSLRKALQVRHTQKLRKTKRLRVL